MDRESKDRLITEETTFDELRAMPGIFSEYMRWIQPTDKGIPVSASIKDYCGFQSRETALALNMMKQQLEDGKGVFTNIYSEEELEKTEELRETRLFVFPGEKDSPLAFIIPGGGYHKVCTMLEGIPIAWKLWSEGYSVAILKYRADQDGVMPKPVDDMAAALKWILSHEETMGISCNNYIVAGFSAGGHLAGEWGTTANGYAKYQLPKPKALILAYAAASIWLYDDELKKSGEPDERAEVAREFMSNLIGKNYRKEDVEQHSVDLQVDECFPPTYLIHSQGDPLAPFESSVCLDEKLSQYQIPHVFTRLSESGHGFALWLNGTQETKNWMDQALAFIDNL